MKRYNLAFLLLLCCQLVEAKPVVNVSPNTQGGISRTIVETWQLSDDEKKSIVTMMSSLSATAIAPTQKIRRGSWTALNSQHKSCFYNTFDTAIEGRSLLKFTVAGKEVNIT